jgi:NAD(P)H-dependent FMN reductase
MFAADAFVIVTTEYNGSYSPALQNLLDHFPKQNKKVFGLAAASTGAMGGMRSTQQLLLLVPALFAIASPQLLVTPFVDKKFDAQGNLLDENFSKSIHLFITDFLWLAEAVYKEKTIPNK